MKILIVSSIPSHPVNAGNRKFINSQIQMFKEMGHEIHFLFIHEFMLGNKQSSDINQMKKEWGNKLYIYKVRVFQKLWRIFLIRYRWIFNHGYYKCNDYYPYKLHQMVNKITKREQFDACIIHYYNLSKLFKYIKIPRLGIVTHDYFAYKNLLIGKPHIYLNTTAHEEAKALQKCPTIFALNDEEANYFQRLSPKSIVRSVYNIYKYVYQPITNNHNILFFSGANEYNLNGIIWFINNILPTIINKYNDAKLIIGGSICNQLKNKINHHNIIYYGFVDNINKFFSQGDIAINPTYQGTGLKIKTFESVAYSKATIVNPHSAVGIYDKEHAPIFIAYKDSDWLQHLDKLWSDSQLIKETKDKCQTYISKMNKYITEQYVNFLES